MVDLLKLAQQTDKTVRATYQAWVDATSADCPRRPLMAENHTIRVVSLFTADEYLAMKAMADDDGLSDSAFIRNLYRMEARRRALARVSEERRLREIEEPAQVLRTGEPE